MCIAEADMRVRVEIIMLIMLWARIHIAGVDIFLREKYKGLFGLQSGIWIDIQSSCCLTES